MTSMGCSNKKDKKPKAKKKTPAVNDNHSHSSKANVLSFDNKKSSSDQSLKHINKVFEEINNRII